MNVLQKVCESDNVKELERLMTIWSLKSHDLYMSLEYAVEKESLKAAWYLLCLGVNRDGRLVGIALKAGLGRYRP
jgi:hypothetical protein